MRKLAAIFSRPQCVKVMIIPLLILKLTFLFDLCSFCCCCLVADNFTHTLQWHFIGTISSKRLNTISYESIMKHFTTAHASTCSMKRCTANINLSLNTHGTYDGHSKLESRDAFDSHLCTLYGRLHTHWWHNWIWDVINVFRRSPKRSQI